MPWVGWWRPRVSVAVMLAARACDHRATIRSKATADAPEAESTETETETDSPATDPPETDSPAINPPEADLPETDPPTCKRPTHLREARCVRVVHRLVYCYWSRVIGAVLLL